MCDHKLKIIVPYDRGFTVKEFYENELSLKQPHLYINYTCEKCNQDFMKKFKKAQAQVIINDL